MITTKTLYKQYNRTSKFFSKEECLLMGLDRLFGNLICAIVSFFKCGGLNGQDYLTLNFMHGGMFVYRLDFIF